MRTTVRLDEDLLANVRAYASASGKTLAAVVEDALQEMLLRRAMHAERPWVSLTTVKGKGIKPGIDLDDTSSLLDLMEVADDST